MRGPEGKIFICKRYNYEWDQWKWFAECYIGDHWWAWEGYTLPSLCDWVLAQAQQYKPDASL